MRKTILKTITIIALTVLMFSVSCFDSENPTPFYISTIISAVWLFLIALANGDGAWSQE